MRTIRLGEPVHRLTRSANQPYFERRLAEELRLAGRARSAAERSVRLRACFLLCTLLGVRAEAHLMVPARHGVRRKPR